MNCIKIILIVVLILLLFKGVSFSKGTEKEKETKYKHIINKIPPITQTIPKDEIESESTTNLSKCVKECNENKECKGYVLMPDPEREDGKTTCTITKLLNEDELEDIDYSRNINMKSYIKLQDGTYKEDTFKISKMYEKINKNNSDKGKYFNNEEKCKTECTNNQNCLQYLTFQDKSCIVMNDSIAQTQEGLDFEETLTKSMFPSIHIFVKK